jgi:uncharacterized protein (TIGR03435 family)
MRLCAIIAGLLLLSMSLVAQRPVGFALASIHEHQFAPGSVVGVDYHPGGRMTANAPIQLLIMSAYDILPAQLQFASRVLDTRQPAFYDIEAKAEPDALPSGRDGVRQMRAMLQQLLADRFKLKVHTEKKSFPCTRSSSTKTG